MKRRAHRSAFALIVVPLGYQWAHAPSEKRWAAFKDAAFDWFSQVCFEHRGSGRGNRDLRRRFGLAWTMIEHLKARYSASLAEILFEKSRSPLLAMLERPTMDVLP